MSEFSSADKGKRCTITERDGATRTGVIVDYIPVSILSTEDAHAVLSIKLDRDQRPYVRYPCDMVSLDPPTNSTTE